MKPIIKIPFYGRPTLHTKPFTTTPAPQRTFLLSLTTSTFHRQVARLVTPLYQWMERGCEFTLSESPLTLAGHRFNRLVAILAEGEVAGSVDVDCIFWGFAVGAFCWLKNLHEFVLF